MILFALPTPAARFHLESVFELLQPTLNLSMDNSSQTQTRRFPTWNLSKLHPSFTLRESRSDIYLKHWTAPNQKKTRVGTLYVNSKQSKGRSPTFVMGVLGKNEDDSKFMYLPFGASRADEGSEKVTLPVRFPKGDPIVQNFRNVEMALKEAFTRSIAKGIPGYESLKNWADSLADQAGTAAPFTVTTSGSGSHSGDEKVDNTKLTTSTTMSGPLWDAVNQAWISKLREDEKYDPMITLQTYESNVNPETPKRNQTLVYEVQFPSGSSDTSDSQVLSSAVTNGIATLQKGTRGVAAFEASKVWFKTRPGRNGTKVIDQCGVILTLRSFAALKNDEQSSEILNAGFNGLFDEFPAPPESRKRSLTESFVGSSVSGSERAAKRQSISPDVEIRVVKTEDDKDSIFDANSLLLGN